MLHALVDVYVPASLEYGNSVVREVLKVQDAIALNTSPRLVNANELTRSMLPVRLLSGPCFLEDIFGF